MMYKATTKTTNDSAQVYCKHLKSLQDKAPSNWGGAPLHSKWDFDMCQNSICFEEEHPLNFNGWR